MKRGGRLLIVSILSVVLSLVLALGPIHHSIYADEVYGIPTTEESTTDGNQTDQDSTDTSSTTDNNNAESNEEEANSDDNTCEAGFAGFGWLICPGQNLITTILNSFLGFIGDSLKWTFLSDNTESVREIWQDFLNIANIVFAIAFMVMIYSMATSTGLSNYDIKKMLPRLIVVAIAVNISFYICGALVDLSNIAGQGVYDLLVSRMEGETGLVFAVNLVTGAVGIIAAAIAIIFLGGAAIIGLLIILLAVSFRQVALMLLVIVSPVAMALYTLPNTEKWGKRWFSLFFNMLIVYPMFMAVWGGAQLVSNIVSNTNGALGIVPFITSILCSIAPALAILPLFKMSGGLLGSVTKAMQGSGAAKGASKAITSGIKQTKPVTGGRRHISTAALKMQNAFGDTPVVGRVLRGPAANRVVNYAQDFATEQDKKAMGSASNWAKGLSGGQLTDLVTTGAYTDDKGRSVRISDSHKMRAAIEASKDNLDASDWHKAMHYVNDRAAQLEHLGRGVEANQLRQTFASTAIGSKAMVIPNGSIASFGDGKWDANHFEAEYGHAASKFANRLSPSKINSMPPVAHEDMRKSMYDSLNPSNTAGMSQADIQEIRKDFDSGVATAQAMARSALANDKLGSDRGKAGEENLNMTIDGFRTSSQQDLANQYGLDQMFQNYNDSISNYRKAIKSGDLQRIRQTSQAVMDSTRPAKELMAQVNYHPASQVATDYSLMTKEDRSRLDRLSRLSYNDAPSPVKLW